MVSSNPVSFASFSEAINFFENFVPSTTQENFKIITTNYEKGCFLEDCQDYDTILDVAIDPEILNEFYEQILIVSI